MTTYFVTPCGAAKAAAPAPASELYVSATFRHYLAAALAEAEATRQDLGHDVEVLILSAKHGLLGLAEMVAPYDVTMTDAEAISAEALRDQLVARGMDWDDEVYAMLPKKYLARLEEAAWDATYGVPRVLVFDVYEAAPGIGYQRGVASCLLRKLKTPSNTSR